MKYRVLIAPALLFVSASAIHIPDGFGVNFKQSMHHTIRYDQHQADKDWTWRLAEDLYTKYIITDLEYAPTARIPKIIHQIWLGSPFPERYKAWRDSWIKHHPDWQYMLWTEKEIAKFGLVNKDLYNTATNYGEKSDIARYEILYRLGGLYIDVDFECRKPFDILHHCCDFYGGLSCSSRFQVINCLIGSAPEHPILRLCIEQLSTLNSTTIRDSTPGAIIGRTGPVMFTRCIQKYLPGCTDRTILFPTTYFFPCPILNGKIEALLPNG